MNTKLHLNDLPSNKVNWVKLSDFENICFSLAKEHMTFNEPIPEFVTRNPGILESCLESPLQKFDNIDLYPEFIDKLSILFYLMIKNHPFRNGNKRLAVVTLLATLFLNNLWLTADELKPYELAKKVAASRMSERDDIIKVIDAFITKYLTRL